MIILKDIWLISDTLTYIKIFKELLRSKTLKNKLNMMKITGNKLIAP